MCISTADQLDALRTQLGTITGPVHVSARMGDRTSALNKHRSIEIIDVSVSEAGAVSSQADVLQVEREYQIRWTVSFMESATDAEALGFATEIRNVMVGDLAFKRRHQLRYSGEEPAIEREGGIVSGIQTYTSARAMPASSV